MLDLAKTIKLISQCCSDEIVPNLIQYIKIPNESPAFDPDWAIHGYMDEGVGLFERWARASSPFSDATPRAVDRARLRDCLQLAAGLWAKAARSRSSPWSERSFRKRSWSSPACSGRIRTH